MAHNMKTNQIEMYKIVKGRNNIKNTRKDKKEM